MNNVAKFNATKNAISSLKEQVPKFQEEANKLLDERGESSKRYSNAVFKVLSVSSLSINNEKAIISFCSDGLYYAQPIWVRKRRINAVPSCFLIQLYKQKLKEAKLRKDEWIDIPFELRGFWKMDQALKFVDELNRMQLLWILNIYRIRNYKRENAEKVKAALSDLSKTIEALEILPPKKGCIKVKKQEESFIVRTKNMKLDVVPLCKLFATYYVSIVSKIEECTKVAENDVIVDGVMTKIIEDFEVLIKNYFMMPVITP